MKTKLISIGATLVLIISMILIYQWKAQKSYTTDVTKQRKEKEIWMSNSLESPFNVKQVVFDGLKYFEPSTKYRIEADFKKLLPPDQVTLITNEGTNREYDVYGEASFILDGQLCTLQLLSSEEELGSTLFIPFMDATSGEESYGAGRYLETTIPNSPIIELDFNQAYNPYCAYMEGYTCPFPPKANVLSVLIRAGEKVY